MPALPYDPRSVFLNVPFDRLYQPFFVTLVSTLVCLGQTPRCVLEIRETGQGRLARIFELLRICGASFHDLCRAGQPARFNMPFELGLACGLALTGERHEVVVLDTVKYRLDRKLSDYKGRDPLIYKNLDGIVDCVADIFQVKNEPTPAVLKSEAHFLRKLAREIAVQYGGTLFRPSAFRALVAASTERAKSRGFVAP